MVPQRIGESFFNGLPAPAAGDGFGASVAMTDFDSEYCEDLAIGAPGADGGRGAVVLAFGSVNGISASGAIRLVGRTAGEHFGSVVIAAGQDVWVAAPDRTVSGRARAGAVDHYRVEGDTATLVETLSESASGVPGTAEAGDRFGQTLAAGPDAQLVIGEPLEDTAGAVNAGSVTVMFTSPVTHRMTSAQTFSQASPGVSGVAESGDHFGASVSIDRGIVGPPDPARVLIAVGVPGEDAGALADTGQVQVFDVAASTRKQLAVLTQNTTGVPGSDQAGDQFGTAVLLAGLDFDTLGGPNLAVGVPGKDIGTARDAGVVDKVLLDVKGAVIEVVPSPYQLHQGASIAHLGGTPETGDHFGAGLFPVARPDWVQQYDEVSHGGAFLNISVPGEDYAGTNSGTIACVACDAPLPASYQDTAGPTAYEYYGSGATAVSNGANIYIN
jgi:hypothetical protein